MTSKQQVPFLDLVTPHQELEAELIAVVQGALKTAGFIGGPMVEAFEAEFAQFCGTEHCVGVGSGTDALRFALMATGVEKDDIVITVPNTFIATTEAITQAGAHAKFVDVDERTSNMDPGKLAEFLETECAFDGISGQLVHRETGGLVRAIVPVHLYGQMADMDPIVDQAEKYNLLVVEDACQAHGAQYFSRRHEQWFSAGSIGCAAAFSFYPGKNLGACGEAGAVTTNDAEMARKIRMIRDHGQAQKYYHDMEGYNGRLDSIQAGLLSVKLKHLADWNTKRREAAARYNQLFTDGGTEVLTPYEPCWSRAVYHLYVVRCADREGLRESLNKEGIGTGIHYPIPLHLQKAYASLGYREGDFPITESLAKQIVSLPMSTTLTAEQQAMVVNAVQRALASRMCEQVGN